MQHRNIARSLLPVFALLLACGDPVTAPEMKPSGPLFEEQSCPPVLDAPDPNCPDTPIAEPDQVFSYAVAEFDAAQPAESSDPVWNGETALYVEDYAKVCPIKFDGGVVTVYQGIRFWVPPTLVYTGPAGSYGDTPVGYYESMGQIISMDGKWELVGGVKIACNGRYYQVPRTGIRMWFGTSDVLNAYGTVRSTNGSVGGTARNGWAWGGAQVSVQSGVGSGWEIALDAYLQAGECTAGWDIWVDGSPVCKAGVGV